MQRRPPTRTPRQLSLFEEEHVTPKWAAEYLRCSVMTVLRYVEEGRIKGYQMCDRGWWRILKASLVEYENKLRDKMSLPRRNG